MSTHARWFCGFAFLGACASQVVLAQDAAAERESEAATPTVDVVRCAHPVEVVLHYAAPDHRRWSDRTMSWLSCGNDTDLLSADMIVDGAHSSIFERNAALAQARLLSDGKQLRGEIELAADLVQSKTRITLNGIPVGARDVALPGQPEYRLSAFPIQTPKFRIAAKEQPARTIAEHLARSADWQIEGLEHVTTNAISLSLSSVNADLALQILASFLDLRVLCTGPGAYALADSESSAITYQHLVRLEAAKEQADNEAYDQAFSMLARALRPTSGGIDTGAGQIWREATRRAIDAGDLVRAERLAREYLEFSKRMAGCGVGDEHAIALAALAEVKKSARDTLAQAQLLRQALAIAEPIHGDRNLAVADMQLALGEAYVQQGKLSDAERWLAKSILSYELADETSRHWLISALSALSLLYLDQDRHQDAIASLRRQQELDSPSDPDVIERRVGNQVLLAGALYRTDQLASAAFEYSTLLEDHAQHEYAGFWQQRLDAIRLLGPYAIDSAASPAEHQRWQETLGSVQDENVAREAAGLLLERATRLHRTQPDGAQRRATCGAYADVFMVANKAMFVPTPELREHMIARCEEQSEASVEPGKQGS